MINKSVNYYQIFLDILRDRCPEKENDILPLLQKKRYTCFDILYISDKLFDVKTHTNGPNQVHRSYKKCDVFEILEYQIKHRLSNSELAKELAMSRNTIAKWKRLYFIRQDMNVMDR